MAVGTADVGKGTPTKVPLHSASDKKLRGKDAFIWDAPEAGKVPEGLDHTMTSPGSTKKRALQFGGHHSDTAAHGKQPKL